jgi:hypothetical protein
VAATSTAPARVEDVLAALRDACQEPGLDRVVWEGTAQGSVLGVWPPGIDEPTALAVFLARLREVLAGRRATGRLRLRAAVAEGITLLGASGFEGRAISAACRACSGPWLEGLLARSPAAEVVVAVTEHLYRDLAAAVPGRRAPTAKQTFVDGPWVWCELAEDQLPSVHGEIGQAFGGTT